MRRRALLAALLAAAVALPSAPAAAAPVRTLTITAGRSGSVDWTFARAVTLHPARTKVASGSYAGFYLQPLDRAPHLGFGQVLLGDFRFGSHPHFPVPFGAGGSEPYLAPGTPWRIPAGRYRIHVFGDRPTVARLALSGITADRRVGASRPSRVVVASRDVTPSVADHRVPAPGGTVADTPVELPRTALSFAAVFMARHGVIPEGSTATACLRPPGEAGCIRDGAPADDAYRIIHAATLTPVPVIDATSTHAWYYFPGTLPGGAYEGEFTMATTNLVDKLAVAVFSLGF